MSAHHKGPADIAILYCRRTDSKVVALTRHDRLRIRVRVCSSSSPASTAKQVICRACTPAVTPSTILQPGSGWQVLCLPVDVALLQMRGAGSGARYARTRTCSLLLHAEPKTARDSSLYYYGDTSTL